MISMQLGTAMRRSRQMPRRKQRWCDDQVAIGQRKERRVARYQPTGFWRQPARITSSPLSCVRDSIGSRFGEIRHQTRVLLSRVILDGKVPRFDGATCEFDFR